MPVRIEHNVQTVASMDDVVAFMQDNKIDPSDPESLRAAFLPLAQLANDKVFLARRAIDDLEDMCTSQDANNKYSAQAILLLPPGTDNVNYFIRANFWPAESDAVYKSGHPSDFVYGFPHDHNFNFLTIGYYGSGYVSENYECESESVQGYPGESVRLKFLEKSALGEGQVMLYRAFQDVHNQLPPEEMSISLNICEYSGRSGLSNQYSYDLDAHKVSGIVNPNAAASLMSVAADLCGEEGRDILMRIASGQASDRLRFAAVKSTTPDDRQSLGNSL